MTLPASMLATATAPAVSLAAPAPAVARPSTPATRTAARPSTASRVVRAALCVLLAWTAAVLAASSYLGAWERAQALRRADAAAAATSVLKHP